jgi:hypothetical protein
MITNHARLFLFGVATLVLVSPSAFAQRNLGKRQGPTSKVYVAEAKGDTQIQSVDRIYTARQATAFDAPGASIETKENSHDALVYSNGTGVFIDQNTRVDIARFVQEPFVLSRNDQADVLSEPSISRSDVFVSRGVVGVCTNMLISGSSMNYGTPQGAVTIRGGKLSLETNGNETIVDLLEGDITVRAGGKDSGGQILRPGERAVIRTAALGQSPRITISPIPSELLPVLDERVTIACNAKKTVTFEVMRVKAVAGLEGPATVQMDDATDEDAQEIQAKPTVPLNLPYNIVVSPHMLAGG